MTYMSTYLWNILCMTLILRESFLSSQEKVEDGAIESVTQIEDSFDEVSL